MINKNLILAYCFAAALFTGCVTAPQIPVELQYSPPPVGVPVATIKGSEERSALLDNFTAFIVTIDGKLVMAGRKGWDRPISIEAGHHILSVKFNRGVFIAHADFDLDAVVDANYQLRFASDVNVFGNNSYVDFWIADMATSKAVSPIKQAIVAGGNNVGFVPIILPPK